MAGDLGVDLAELGRTGSDAAVGSGVTEELSQMAVVDGYGRSRARSAETGDRMVSLGWIVVGK
jgi:hypothetical protein